MGIWDRLRPARWLGPKGPREADRETDRETGTPEELEALVARARDASASFRPHYHLRAARLAESLGLESRALSLYGAAIDGYLEEGRSRAAEVVCRQVVAGHPQVLRARRTLALIALGRGDAEEAEALLRDYAEHARRFGDRSLTRKSLRTMGLLAQPGPVRRRAAAELGALGDESGARLVTEGDTASGDGLAPDPGASWDRAIQAALQDARTLGE